MLPSFEELLANASISSDKVTTTSTRTIGTSTDSDTDTATTTTTFDSVKLKGSFGQCTTFFGGRRDRDTVEEFISRITTYKDIEAISDEDALRGVPLLFHGLAATWWQGVQQEAHSWTDVIALLREYFCPKKPLPQIYLDIFRSAQDEQCDIDVFICQKRALLAQLPAGRHDTATELDFIYGLLRYKLRKKVLRSEVATFKELLDKCRFIEQLAREKSTAGSSTASEASGKLKRCEFCSKRGHNVAECRKRLANATGTQTKNDAEDFQAASNRPGFSGAAALSK